ncbi:MAG: helix-turn-helix domain-containing protein, partial [Actinomycetes bacterium]
MLTQHDRAAAVGISVDVIRKLELGHRHTASIATLTRLARVLDVELADLAWSPRPAAEQRQPTGQVS